jgi:hypothetical protein
MPVTGGPNTLGESSLVFAYDTGDVKNSYKGQPTVNVLPSSNVLLTSYNDHGGTHVTDTGFTLFGNATLRNTSNPAQDWNGVYLTGLSSILTPGVTYTYSFYIYFTSDNTTISYFGYGAPGYTGVKGQWNRVSTTFTATTQDYFYVTLQYSNGQPVSTYYLANLQIEQKSNPTQFINGTRSATQGLLPLIGNSTINLTNVSFDSSAKIVFDGTNDYINIGVGTGINQFSGDFTVSLWAMRTAGGNYGNLIGDYYTNSTQTTGEWQIMMGPSSELNLYKVGPGYVINNIASGFSNNTWINVVVTRSGNLVTMYANSNAIATGTDSTSYGTVTGNLNIGIDGNNSSEPFPGKIDKVEIYNRALTSQEVKQNYQQYKTRFNLS